MFQDSLLMINHLLAGYSKPVVGPVSFTVQRGDVIGIRGANGSGKSTLLNAIAGSARIFSGSVQRKQGLRISHQQQAALPLDDVPLSGRELLALTGADARGLPDWIMPLIGKRLDRLSGGQLQFMQIWACLKAPVDVVLLDEPTNNVDPPGVRHLETEIEQMRSSHAIVIISHDRVFLDTVTTRTVELGS